MTENNQKLQLPQRVAPLVFPERYELPGRPPASAGTPALDAHRQTQFLLSGDLDLFAQGMNLHLRVIADSYPVRYRTHRLAALAAFWSRAFAYLADACALVTRGSYVSCPPLIRAACDCIAAQRSLLTEAEWPEFTAWLADALRANREHQGTEIGLGRFRAGSIIAQDDRLGPIYRLASDLALTHFGPTLLQVAPESSRQRLVILFADSAFHLGWAELLLGWLLTLADAQLQVAFDAEGVFNITAEVQDRRSQWQQQVEKALTRRDRCHVEEVIDGMDRRYVIHGFRRASGGDPKKLII